MALMPIPEASAMGRFANRPIAVSAALNGIPAASIIAGFTAMMYAMARNVVRPPMTSLETVLPRSDILKNLSSM